MPEDLPIIFLLKILGVWGRPWICVFDNHFLLHVNVDKSQNSKLSIHAFLAVAFERSKKWRF